VTYLPSPFSAVLTHTLEIEIPAAQSTAVSTIQAALDAAKEIGYPIILRSAFSLGGLGSGFAHDEEELRNLAAKSLSLSPQVLIEKSLKGWKEVEYEVVRDAADVSRSESRQELTTEHHHLLQHGEL
jgi:carbamoylphosphate synthase large subunit